MCHITGDLDHTFDHVLGTRCAKKQFLNAFGSNFAVPKHSSGAGNHCMASYHVIIFVSCVVTLHAIWITCLIMFLVLDVLKSSAVP